MYVCVWIKPLMRGLYRSYIRPLSELRGFAQGVLTPAHTGDGTRCNNNIEVCAAAFIKDPCPSSSPEVAPAQRSYVPQGVHVLLGEHFGAHDSDWWVNGPSGQGLFQLGHD